MSQNKSFLPLSGNKLFNGIQVPLKEKFPQSNYVNYNEGDVVYQSGDTSDCMYLILAGEVKIKIPITMGGPSIERKGENEFFGEKELMENIPRRSSAVANTGCTLYKLIQKDVKKLMSVNKKIGENILIGTAEISSIENNDDDASFDESSDFPEDSKWIEESEKTDEGTENTDAGSEAFSINEINDQTDDILLEELPEENSSTGVNEPGEIVLKDENIEEEINFDSFRNVHEEDEPAEIPDINEEINEELVLPDQDDLSEDIKDDSIIITEQNEEVEATEVELIEHEPPSEVADERNETGQNLPQEEEENEVEGEKLKTDESLYKNVLKAVLQINKETELNEVLYSVSETLKEILKADLVRVYIYNNAQNELCPISINEEKEKGIKLGEGLTGWAAEKKEIVMLNSAAEDSRYNKEKDSFGSNNNVLIIPVINGSDELEILILSAKLSEEFTGKDKEFLTELSIYIAAAIEKQKQFDSHLKESRSEYLKKVSGFIFNNIDMPVQIIQRYAEFIKKKTGVNDVVQIADFIGEQTRVVENSIELISDFINGKNSLSLKQQSINELLNSILEMLAEYVETRDVNLFKKLEADAKVNADQTALYFVCLQITKNACDAMPEGGNFYLSTSIENNFVNIEFKDTGFGISSIIKDRIFEPFFSFGKDKAAGLGLAVAENIIKNLGGKIFLGKSGSDGTAIIISLPVVYE